MKGTKVKVLSLQKSQLAECFVRYISELQSMVYEPVSITYWYIYILYCTSRSQPESVNHLGITALG